MSRNSLSKKIKTLGDLSRIEKMRMNEWIIKKSEILQQMTAVDESLLNLDNQMNDEYQKIDDAIVPIENYTQYIMHQKDHLYDQKKALIADLDKAQRQLNLYFRQHKIYENLQLHNSESLSIIEQKEQRDILDEIATLRYVRKTKI